MWIMWKKNRQKNWENCRKVQISTKKVIHNFLCKHKKSTLNWQVIHNYNVDKVDNFVYNFNLQDF